jgi:hypothetical protein
VTLLAAAIAVVVAVAAGGPTAQAAPEPPRQPLVVIPEGCPLQQTADVVFVGTVVDSDYRTARFRIDQIRAGDLGRFASQVGDHFLVDVRYGVDTKYLTEGEQFLIGASVPAGSASGLLESKVAERPSALGGDEIIGADETQLECPEVDDPNLTLHTDGTMIDAGLLTPLVGNREGVLRAVLVAPAHVLGGILALAAVRWVLTGFGRGVESAARARRHPQRRASTRT